MEKKKHNFISVATNDNIKKFKTIEDFISRHKMFYIIPTLCVNRIYNKSVIF